MTGLFLVSAEWKTDMSPIYSRSPWLGKFRPSFSVTLTLPTPIVPRLVT